MTETKPLFLPLIKKYYYMIKHRMQDCEIRPNNHLTACGRWCSMNVYPGKNILFSNGYGKHDRVVREIRSTLITGINFDLKSAGIPQWHIDAVENIYGKRESWLIAYV